MKTIVVPSGDGQGLRHEGNGKRTKVDLRWLTKPLKASLGGMGGSPTVLLPGLAGLKPEDLKNLGEVALKGYEILDREGRMKVDVLMRAGLSLRSLAVAALIVAIGLIEVTIFVFGLILATNQWKTHPCSACMCGIRLSGSPQVFLNPNQSFGPVAR